LSPRKNGTVAQTSVVGIVGVRTALLEWNWHTQRSR
jgi:hypothetical protein